MAHIFRIYDGGASTYQGWNGSPTYPYNATNRNTIADPNGATAKNEITSIPSPFARVDLVKNAFREVCENKNLDGNTIFHKMVSDSLDVGEIFFNTDKFKDKVEIITWDAEKNINELKTSDDPGKQYLGDALSKYLIADATTYNFAQMKNIYLLNYINGPAPLNILGATSPATLFFSNANDLSLFSDDLSFGQDKPFDNAYQPLYKRDFDYIKAWFVFRSCFPSFATCFPEVNDYLDLTFKAITDTTKKKILNTVTVNDSTSFLTIDVNAVNQTNIVEILGKNIFRKDINIGGVKSDFEIRQTRSIQEKILVLPTEKGNKYSDLKYVTDNWGTENAAHYSDNRSLNQRTLPQEGRLMPYLTISDFLEDNIIRVPHSLNKDNYFDGNIEIREDKLSYLIPLKPLFFKYFSSDDLLKVGDDGKTMLTMETLAGGSVKIILRIPIKGNGIVCDIEYIRIYYNNCDADISVNKGGIKEFGFSGIIMPLVKFTNEADALYKVACVSTINNNYSLTFYQNDLPLQEIKPSCRHRLGDNINYKAGVYSVQGKNFEYIQITRNICSGIIIPKFKQQSIINSYNFAVDLGTSNTHIEFTKNGNNISQPFQYGKSDVLVSSIFNPSFLSGGGQDDLILEDSLIERDFLPKEVSNMSDFSFPTRTVLSYGKNTNWDKCAPFESFNIPLTYDKRTPLDYNAYECNIKWTKGDGQKYMSAYIDCLMLMLRNKVLIDDGNLEKTNITWFYPTSMPQKRLTKLRDSWNEAFKKYFNNTRETVCMTESFAPIQYYYRRYATTTNLINIDIGGGTTDIAYSIDQKIEFATSFRFATNCLFENSYADQDSNNGIVDYYKNIIKNVISSQGIHDIESIFNNDNNVLHPANMASFLFSLKENSKVSKLKSESIDFNYLLQQDDDYRIVFVIFYTAILYHVAQIVKLKSLPIPRHISLGGNGSKVLRVITTDNNLLAEYTNLIFEEVMGQSNHVKLEILGLDGNSYSKESTCKGGLLGQQSDDERKGFVVMKSDATSFLGENDSYDKLTDVYRDSVIGAVDDFFKFFFRMNDKFDFDSNFGLNKSSLSLAKEICGQDVATYLDKGISSKKKEVDETSKIEETFFFYPVKGIINALSQKIYDDIKSK
jgi:hypothetical protein